MYRAISYPLLTGGVQTCAPLIKSWPEPLRCWSIPSQKSINPKTNFLETAPLRTPFLQKTSGDCFCIPETTFCCVEIKKKTSVILKQFQLFSFFNHVIFFKWIRQPWFCKMHVFIRKGAANTPKPSENLHLRCLPYKHTTCIVFHVEKNVETTVSTWNTRGVFVGWGAIF